MPAAYEIRITPLLLGVPDLLETDDFGITVVEEADVTIVTQFLDVEVNIAINEPLTGRVVLPMEAPANGDSTVAQPWIADLRPFQQACWIGYKRPGNTVAEGLIYGPCNVTEDFAAGTVTLDVYDPVIRCQHHYVRRGDAALNLTNETGTVASSQSSIETIIDAARNTQEQQDRNVPALALTTGMFGDGVPDAPLVQFERGQEVWDLCQQIIRSTTGPDLYSAPTDAWEYPLAWYSELGLYDGMTDPTAPGVNELGRNLDPADPDAPAAGEVVFDYGEINDNLIALNVEPGIAVTHCHVVDADRKYRNSAADAASSALIGVWVRWIATDSKVVGGDTSPLQALADATVDAYGTPPKFFTCTLRPDDAQPFHYGHRYWAVETPGAFQIGDFVRARANRGYRSFSVLARITAAKFSLANGLPQVDLSMIPAIPGAAGEDPQGT
jgi:hypothetical protein